jgi:flagellar protein FlgJ
MDVSSLGAAYIDDYHLNASSLGLAKDINRIQDTGKGAQNFAEILKKTASGSQNDNADSAGTSSPKSSIDKTDKLYEQCLELETFLVKTLISSMRSTVQKSGLIDEGFAGKMYEDMLYDEYAKDFTRNANFGLAEQAYLELTGRRGEILIRRAGSEDR